MIRSAEARSRVADPVMILGRSWLAIRSRKSRNLSSSSRVRMPSCMACWTPWAQLAAIAREISPSMARPAMAPRVLCRAVAEKPLVLAAWAANWIILWPQVGNDAAGKLQHRRFLWCSHSCSEFVSSRTVCTPDMDISEPAIPVIVPSSTWIAVPSGSLIWVLMVISWPS